jgi:hypothetical protein
MFVCRVGTRVRASAELVLKPAELVPMIAEFQLPGHRTRAIELHLYRDSCPTELEDDH